MARITPVCLSPPMAFLSGVIWGAGWAVALPCPGQGGHQFSNLMLKFCGTLHRVSGHCIPSPYFLSNLLVLTFCLAGSNHQLKIRGPGVAVEIPDGISDVLVNPMEETVFQVLYL